MASLRPFVRLERWRNVGKDVVRGVVTLTQYAIQYAPEYIQTYIYIIYIFHLSATRFRRFSSVCSRKRQFVCCVRFLKELITQVELYFHTADGVSCVSQNSRLLTTTMTPC